MKQKLLLITNSKSVFAFQNLPLYFTCDATQRRKRRFVTSGLPENREKQLISQKRYEMEQKLLLITNNKSVFAFQNMPLHDILHVTPPGGEIGVMVYHKLQLRDARNSVYSFQNLQVMCSEGAYEKYSPSKHLEGNSLCYYHHFQCVIIR